MRIILWTVSISACLLCSMAAFAEDETDEARAQYQQGIKLYEDGKYEQASISFERAYELAPQFRILWNIGQVQNELEHYAAALTAYLLYLEEGGEEVPEDHQKQATDEIKRLKTLVGSVAVECDLEGAIVYVNGKQNGKTPLAQPILLDLGEHEIQVKVSGEEVHSEILRVAGGKELTVTVHSKKETGENPTGAGEMTDDGQGKRVWTWVALGIGGAAGITGGVIGGVAMSKKNTITDECHNGSCPPKYESDGETVEKLALTSDILFGVAAAGVITGVVLFFVEPKLNKETNVAFVPLASPEMSGLSVAGRF